MSLAEKFYTALNELKTLKADKVYVDEQIAAHSGTMPAADILTALKTVDGAGSALDSDLLDSQHGSYYLSRANHTGTMSADSLLDGTTNKAFTATEKTKVSRYC